MRWLRGLRRRLGATRRLWFPTPGSESPAPIDCVVLPAGKLDIPGPGAELPRAPVSFEGWAMFRSGPAVRVELWLGDESLGRARLGLPRPDVHSVTAGPGGAVSGFAHTVNLAARPEGELELRAVATGAAGERLELDSVRFRLAPPPEPPERAEPLTASPKQRDGSRSVAVFTHRLDYGGAQTFLVQLLRGLLRRRDFRFTVISTANGPLRRELVELGVEVHLSTAAPLDDPDGHRCRVEELVSWSRERDFDLALVNTATPLVFGGAELAAALGIPTLWMIHESFSPPILWDDVHPEVRRAGESALAGAAMAIFEAKATQRLYEPWVGRERCLTLPYGLELEPIDELRGDFSRAHDRRESGIDEDAEVLLCVGAIEPRKAQVPLARAFDLIADRHPRAQLVFVGGRPNADSELLEECVAGLASRRRIEIVPMTPAVQRWYGLADLLISASDIESLPRAVLEAMAWELPVLATSVFGLPELIEDGVSGWLCEDRDVSALAAGIERALGTPVSERRQIGRRGRRLIETRHSMDDYCERIAQILDETVTTPGRRAEEALRS
jgi:D-inositol-3-phosphate glycosyltransferase